MSDFRMQSVIIFASSQKQYASDIAGYINRHIPNHVCRICHDAGMLHQARHQFSGQPITTLFWADDQLELDQIVDMASQLDGLTVLLRVPDIEKQTIAKAHRLRPRYIIQSEIDYEELLSVIVSIARHRSRSAKAAPHRIC